MRLTTLARSPDLIEVLDRPELNPGPEPMFHDQVSARFWNRLPHTFGDLQLVLLEDDEVVARGHAAPLAWHGTPDKLPHGGYDWVLEQSFADHGAGRAPTIAAALYIAVPDAHQGRGLSSAMARHLREAAAAKGLKALAAPLRPTFKDRYLLIPMAEYAAWTRPDGTAFDPWLRTHQRLGAHLLHPCEESMVVEGTVEEWRRWSGLDLPGSGRHIVPGALAPVDIDIDADHGRYVEPNLWAWHPLTSRS
ncbi:hypothetical protein [Nocardiopsis dassonvillei]|uniref:hypothetical protein n=1 Tax=Nocardiopsis dassonvillei TaxID=2014 RepID=UPI003F566758